MKTTKIILTAMLAIMSSLTATAEVVYPGVGTRVDYINEKGERVFSKRIFKNDSRSTQGLFEILNNDNGWQVTPSWDITANTVRFVPWGTETYSVSLETEVPVQYYTKSAKKKVERLKEKSQISFNALCGDTIVLEMELPDKAFPVFEIQYEYTDDWNYNSKVPFSSFDIWSFQVPWEYTNLEYWNNNAPYWIEGDPFITRLPANDKSNNRWRFKWIMENEPCVITISYGYADTEILKETVREILYGTLLTNNGGYGSHGEDWILRCFGEAMSAEQINNFAMDNYRDIPGMEWLSSTNYISSLLPWATYYRGIMLSNMLLENLDLFISTTETERNIARAQLLSLRAHCYTRILQIYGKRWSESDNGNAFCAPLILNSNDIQKPLATMADIKRQCENDLNEAIRIFGNANYRQSTLIEPDLNVARGFLMRLALWTNDWQTARDMARQLIADVPLSTNDNMLSGFYTRTDSWIWGASTYFLDEFAKYELWNGSPQDYDACNGGYLPYGISINAIDRDLWLKIPKKDMRRNLFVMPELLNGRLNSIENWYDREYYNYNALQKSYSNEVISLYQERRPEANAFIYNGHNISKIPYGAQLKFWGTGSGFGFDKSNKDGGVLFMRSDEALLTQAEACWHLGEESTARELLTKLNSIRNEDYSCTATGQKLLDEIRLYRSIELWGEGFSWFDWKRWNLPINRKLWVAFDSTSGNWPAGTANVETTAANGWRALIPTYYLEHNPNIDISKMGYTEATGYDGKPQIPIVSPAKASYKPFRNAAIPSKEMQPAMHKITLTDK